MVGIAIISLFILSHTLKYVKKPLFFTKIDVGYGSELTSKLGVFTWDYNFDCLFEKRTILNIGDRLNLTFETLYETQEGFIKPNICLFRYADGFICFCNIKIEYYKGELF
jgi:hypothetical protein